MVVLRHGVGPVSTVEGNVGSVAHFKGPLHCPFLNPLVVFGGWGLRRGGVPWVVYCEGDLIRCGVMVLLWNCPKHFFTVLGARSRSGSVGVLGHCLMLSMTATTFSLPSLICTTRRGVLDIRVLGRRAKGPTTSIAIALRGGTSGN